MAALSHRQHVYNLATAIVIATVLLHQVSAQDETTMGMHPMSHDPMAHTAHDSHMDHTDSPGHTLHADHVTGMPHDHDHSMSNDEDPGNHGHGHGTTTGHGGHNMDHNEDHLASPHGAYFVISNQAVILLKDWVTHDEKTIGLACLYTALFAIAYECLKVLRDHIYTVEKRHRARKNQGKYTLNGNDPAGGVFCSWQLVLLHLVQTILHMVQVFMSLILMLIFMTFNVYLCIAVVGGAGLGYLFIGWKRNNADSDEHCN